jgi:hypothetical protein
MAEPTAGKLKNTVTNEELPFSMNPAEYHLSRGFDYAVEPCLGQPAPLVAFRSGHAAELSFHLIFDRDADRNADPKKAIAFVRALGNVDAASQSGSAALAESLGNGIAVRRCDVFVNGGEATVDVRDARLLHGGVTGERIERFRLRGPYREIVASLRAFGEARAVVGRRRRKHGREWTTEWHLPPAASLGLPIPGSVPPDHYW